MRVLHTRFDAAGSPARLARRLAEAREAGARSVLLLAADGAPWPVDAVDPWLHAAPMPVFGGVFPEVVFDGEHSATGLVTAALADEVEPVIVEALDGAEPRIEPALAALPAGAPALLTFVDAQAVPVARLLQAVAACRPGAALLGGGAGSLTFQPRPCLFTPQGMRSASALLAPLPGTWGLGVEHGWQAVGGPFVVTEAQGCCILRLDGRPAAEVYRACVEPLVGVALSAANFFGHAVGHPFGLARADGSLLVRDPIMMDGGALVCAGEVPEQAALQVLRGDPAGLTAAAVQGAGRACAALGARPEGSLVFDCVGRMLFLGRRFADELGALSARLQAAGASHAPIGALTLGEVAPGRDGPEFLNKACAIGAYAG